MTGPKVLFWISCGILLLVALFTALGSLASTATAFNHRAETIGTVSTDQIRDLGGDDSVNNYKARRLTAATWALGFAILFGWVVIGPYRRGDRWAWWALLVSLGLPQLISLARVPLLSTQSGAGTSTALLAFLLIGLLAGVPRVFSRHLNL
ncbi:MAG TPA: hypothetical protein VLZ81_03645 [Blastocatellia bacterium]|nr:hypothetical protein [Blastocatellia bacterium]